ncbi:transcriptional antiterminator NusG [Candidatus Kinetoplastibacterium desouzaii TCC079E]|uniref:Transcription termination/antitermination protein NusG n=1 Tax=Candidatus Kinetoplastidibacterium desouzai TCC079E TaxID=1208919 RepID=M1M558_9PROT|nr:transcription termination/antitermination protein NusG [Candidatus Kinetoplastibacterium desouzaii]AGF47295.1 transcriptional antiterminator NusG [Candidatus Kinetoplastibacterium desouzaii TCC079E]
MSKSWYIVHVFSGMEKNVLKVLNDRIDASNLRPFFGKILIPSEEVIDVKNGQKNITERSIFPGYMLLEMELTDETWHLVRNTNRITGFLGGSGNKPTPISSKEVEKILSKIEEGNEKPRPKILFEIGEVVRVKDGPFADFNGNVEEINYEKNKIRVSVTIFGRSTPVELEFAQVEKT